MGKNLEKGGQKKNYVGKTWKNLIIPSVGENDEKKLKKS